MPPGTFRVEVDARWPVTRMSPFVGLDAIGERAQGAGVGDRKKKGYPAKITASPFADRGAEPVAVMVFVICDEPYAFVAVRVRA